MRDENLHHGVQPAARQGEEHLSERHSRSEPLPGGSASPTFFREVCLSAVFAVYLSLGGGA